MTFYRAELYGMTAAHEYIYQTCKYLGIQHTHTSVIKTQKAKDSLKGIKRYLSADYDIESRLRFIIQMHHINQLRHGHKDIKTLRVMKN